MRVLLLVGRSGVGKTTLLEQAVRALTADGHKVLACKHSHHDLADQEGTDSARLAEAGASSVALLGQQGFHLFGHPLGLEDLLPFLASFYDVALVEGGKRSPYPKVELAGTDSGMLEPERVVAYLQRGDTPDDPRPVVELLEILWSEGATISPAKA